MNLISCHRQWFSYRGLTPHQFMPMLGVHKALQLIHKSGASLAFVLN